jgi:hypothetical protein
VVYLKTHRENCKIKTIMQIIQVRLSFFFLLLYNNKTCELSMRPAHHFQTQMIKLDMYKNCYFSFFLFYINRFFVITNTAMRGGENCCRIAVFLPLAISVSTHLNIISSWLILLYACSCFNECNVSLISLRFQILSLANISGLLKSIQ